MLAPRRPADILKRIGDQPEGERASKKLRATFPKSLEVIGIDLDPVQGISPMVGESTTEVPTTIPLGTMTLQPSRSEASSSRGKKQLRSPSLTFCHN